MITYPEKMQRLDTDDVKESLQTVEAYIDYICERSDYAIRAQFADIQKKLDELDRRVTALENA